MESCAPTKAARWKVNTLTTVGLPAASCRLRAGTLIALGAIVNCRPTRSFHSDIQISAGKDLLRNRAILQLFAIFQERWSILPGTCSGSLQLHAFRLQSDDSWGAEGIRTQEFSYLRGNSVRRLILWSNYRHGKVSTAVGKIGISLSKDLTEKVIAKVLTKDGGWRPQLFYWSEDDISKKTIDLMHEKAQWEAPFSYEVQNVQKDWALDRLRTLLNTHLPTLLSRNIQTVMLMVTNAHEEFKTAVKVLTDAKLPSRGPSSTTPFVVMLESPNSSWSKNQDLKLDGTERWQLKNPEMVNECF